MGKFVVTYFLLMGIISTIAQSSGDDEIVDIDQLFTSNVEIVDYDARLLLVGDRSYPYPDTIEIIRTDPWPTREILTIWVWETPSEITAHENRSQDNWVWYFDTQTEAFTRFTNQCDDRTSLTPFDVGNPWVYVTDIDTGQVCLCELTTGKTSKALPSHLSWEIQPPISTSSIPVFTSPDGQWLLLFGENNNQIYVFSYNISSNNLTELGQTTCNFCIERDAVRWFGSLITIWYRMAIIT